MCGHAKWAGRRPHFSHSHHGHRDHGGAHHQHDEPRPPSWAWAGAEDMGPSPEGFGVRRPLRFLAHKLELEPKQVEQLAKILDDLKTERAQAAVDDRRTLGEFADALAGDAFDATKGGAGADRRVESAKRLRDAVVRALEQTHAMLNPDQRAKLAYLIRTGVLVI